MTEYELTRRDALKALGAAGITVAGGVTALSWSDRGTDAESEFGDHERRTVYAVAATVYPSELAGIEDFVDAYVAGRLNADSTRAAAMADAVAALDEYASEWEGDEFVALDPATQDETLGAMGVRIATPDPDGDPRQRVRYYLVNDLLFALYSSPTGGRLVGIENPQGHPGGTRSYRRPPE
ncbi:gluconate 2-dehydrogenase subunit 3 family protein [Halomicroarcula sp. S1AR25-4]|uniref:gluconate 2-dehydrogenase subunit 3 family protein n=1 Tax=Haloarcula sp. S1AR25-4 TaxID=2950538 RepID=UPI002876262F|nr:gluconate 2-dehydrogenase subunit 3 family protein [Halomicroarcula sp. S1AR25-4]MDS0276637.1 gluconate 2-dehydrogenase subunit 3 family protein [Halomicroarcula sp. S1AR25-4]